MLSIKFSRIGKKKQPSYRIIVLEKKKDPWGDFLEDLGYYNPFTKKRELKKERIKYWLSKGAQTSETVHNLLIEDKVIAGVKIKLAKSKNKKEAGGNQPIAEEKKTVSPEITEKKETTLKV
ncbi:MAG: small subunit ribosomal protein S16 [Parcubacteria group bacterium Athens1014_10]|nr:MAG: small subunit ribosomal protein S16 [Parcubacteria group bacterium Athens1014_10]TSD05936.1 MAG: small subunit ribosomal protein S16 [Parcubacteria group bacterium Athens0714_12]